MKKYNVVCTLTYNADVIVCANNEEEAIEVAYEMLNRNNDKHRPSYIEQGDVCFDFGDITVDYADEM